MKPTIRTIVDILELFKNSFEASDIQRKMLERWQNEMKTSIHFRSLKVFEAIQGGCRTIADISEFTNIDYLAVRRIIPKLIAQNKIIETSYKAPHRRGAAQRFFKIKE